METETRKPVRNLPETIHSLLGLKSHFTSAWVKSVCNIVKNVPSPSSSKRSKSCQMEQLSVDEEDDSVSIEVQIIKDELSALTASVNDLNARRRKILNELLDLKGNIRVFCRVRPIRTVSGSAVASDTRNVAIRLTENKSKVYSFDRVFVPDSSQDEVFLEIEPVIKSVIDGYNACILAYGQTGTGKTFTMEGVPEDPGTVPRAIRSLFEQAEESNNAFLVNFSMLEIYMGNLRDLLVPQATRSKDAIPPRISIHADAKGEIEIENLVAIKVNDFHHALKLYRLGCRNRSTASTSSNSSSSRSHCMIRVTMTWWFGEERERRNKIWLVDLAGSERVLKTRAIGRRLDEGKAINLSLSSLGDVIYALQHRKPHIPYRNSKLTQVLKDSLGQDSKTLMLVHVSPKEDDLCETICSLNFATRAKNIHLGQNESTEEREKKEGAIENLQRAMEKIEQERQIASRGIRNLNEKLEKLTRKPQEQEQEQENVIMEERQCNKEAAKKKTGNAGNRLPSFMKPTVSSRKKSGRDRNVTHGDSAISTRPRRTWRSSSIRAESVCFPVKKNDFNSVCNSDRSISKSTCVAAGFANADSATIYSQDMSECEIKVVVSENKRKLQMGSDLTNTHFKICNAGKDLNRTTGEHEFSRVDNWLQSQTEHSEEQVAATPFPEKQISLNNFAPQKIIGRETAEKTKGMEERKPEEPMIKPTLMLKDLFQMPCCCSAESDDQTLPKAVNSEEDDIYLYPPTAGYEELSQYTDEEEGYILREEFSDRFMVENGVSRFSSVQEDDYNADSERDSSVSISMFERDSDIKQFSKEHDSEVESVIRPKSQRALALTDQEDDIPPLLGPQESSGQKGKARMDMEKVEALCFSALLGLGFMDLGYGSDFFYGLAK
ncbi:PREDICTED: kinesin-II 85 kDa subunit [Tarenaya hassleriana]|uniref:kinesin-II 85 kDa subunit n=1 Tax=Tarenaya hassleriana TaxID=28532 RepID=UPI00053C4BFC|nr:PREDICTED: kinesin-II 85 kDa subunit [Tarenaya hassleriana]